MQNPTTATGTMPAPVAPGTVAPAMPPQVAALYQQLANRGAPQPYTSANGTLLGMTPGTQQPGQAAIPMQAPAPGWNGSLPQPVALANGSVGLAQNNPTSGAPGAGAAGTIQQQQFANTNLMQALAQQQQQNQYNTTGAGGVAQTQNMNTGLAPGQVAPVGATAPTVMTQSMPPTPSQVPQPLSSPGAGLGTNGLGGGYSGGVNALMRYQAR